MVPFKFGDEAMFLPQMQVSTQIKWISFPSALRLPKFMGFISLSPMAQQYVSFPSLNLTQNMSFPLPSIPKRCIGFVFLSFVTPKIYGFRSPQPHVPTIILCVFTSLSHHEIVLSFPQPVYTNNMQVSFPSASSA